MECIAYLHRTSFLGYPTFYVGKWAKEVGGIKLHLVTSCLPEQVDPPEYESVTFLDHEEADLSSITKKLVDNHNIEALVSHYETDMTRIAQLRENFDIAGQSNESATAYRHKAIMKQIVAAAGLRVPKFRQFDNTSDVKTQILNEFSYPFVVKRVDGLGSEFTFIVHNDSDLDAIEIFDHVSDLLVEEYIQGDLYHVDGVVCDSEIVFSTCQKYFGTTLNFLQGLPIGSRTIVQDSELAMRLKDFAHRVVGCLPETDNFAFHGEFFVTNEGEVVLCEIASRPPGALVPWVFNSDYGININEVHIKLQLGQKYTATDFPEEPKKYSGWITFMPDNGKLQVVDDEIPEHLGVIKSFRNYEPGTNYQISDSIVNYLLGVVVSADSARQLEERCELAMAWFRNNFIFS